MAVADLLEKIGEGAKTVGRVAGAVAEPLAKRTAEVISGEAPEIDQDKRARAEKLEDEQLAARASILENSLAMGQKYGTLTPDQQQQYVETLPGSIYDLFAGNPAQQEQDQFGALGNYETGTGEGLTTAGAGYDLGVRSGDPTKIATALAPKS